MKDLSDECEGRYSREQDQKLGILVKITNYQSLVARGYRLMEADGRGKFDVFVYNYVCARV